MSIVVKLFWVIVSSIMADQSIFIEPKRAVNDVALYEVNVYLSRPISVLISRVLQLLSHSLSLEKPRLMEEFPAT